MIQDLLIKNRSTRRFKPNPRPSLSQLEVWVGNLRYTASGRNAQAIKYMLITDEDDCHQLCSLLAWAGYLKDWAGPEREEEPTAYAIQLLDLNLSQTAHFDDGLQAQALTLQAMEQGFASCILTAINRKQVQTNFNIGEDMEILSVIALGTSAERIIIEDITAEKPSIQYYRDENSQHHVPKRQAKDFIYHKD